MTAIDIINSLENQGIILWADDDGLHYEGDISIVTPAVIDMLKSNKPAIIEALLQSAANDEPLPTRWLVALSILDDMVKEKRDRMVYDKAPIRIERRDWRKRYQLALSLNDFETERLEQDLRSNHWVYFNNIFETVERTTPEFEAMALEFFNWSRDRGINGQFLSIPTGIVNHGRIRTLPADTVQGLKRFMKQYDSAQ